MNDLISRQEAIDSILLRANCNNVRELYEYVQMSKGLAQMWYGGINVAIDEVIAVPPAQDRKTGKWIEKEVIHKAEAKDIIEEWQSCRCSVCGRYHTQPYMYYFDNPNYCSFCGAEMKSVSS